MRGDCLILSTGRTVNAMNSIIGISPDGEIDDGYGNVESLTLQEKGELIDYASKHWTNWREYGL